MVDPDDVHQTIFGGSPSRSSRKLPRVVGPLPYDPSRKRSVESFFCNFAQMAVDPHSYTERRQRSIGSLKKANSAGFIDQILQSDGSSSNIALVGGIAVAAAALTGLAISKK